MDLSATRAKLTDMIAFSACFPEIRA